MDAEPETGVQMHKVYQGTTLERNLEERKGSRREKGKSSFGLIHRGLRA